MAWLGQSLESEKAPLQQCTERLQSNWGTQKFLKDEKRAN